MIVRKSRLAPIQVGFVVLALGAILALCGMEARSAKAAENQFCWGKNLPQRYSGCSNGSKQYMYGAYAQSAEQPVCVQIGSADPRIACSQNPNEGAYVQAYGGYTEASYFNFGTGPGKFYGVYWDGPQPPPLPPPPPPPPPVRQWGYDTIAISNADEPAISSRSSGSLDLFVKNSKDQLVRGHWTGSVWVTDEVVAADIASAPSSVSWSSNRIDIVARMDNDTVGHWYCNPCTPNSTTWGFDSMGGSIAGKPAISSWSQNRLDIFARDKASNKLIHRWWQGVAWSAWENHGGELASSPDAVSWGPNRIDVVARTSGGQVQQFYWNGAGWQWNNLGGNITHSPSISSWEPNRLDVWVRDAADGSLQHRYWMGHVAAWMPWEDHGGFMESGPDAVSWGKERVDVVGKGPVQIAHWFYY